MTRVGIALGSNLGDRPGNLRAALAALRALAVPGQPVLASPVYRTEPRDCPPGSPDFLNAVAELAFDGGPFDLLERTRAIETTLGRTPRAPRNAPRVIDIDLLYFGDAVLQHPALTLPHPRLSLRRFVLQPLADIRPALVLPGQSHAIADLLAGLADDEPPLVRWSGPL